MIGRVLFLLRGFRQETRGAAFVEFAITLPLILILFAATVDGARMLWSYQKAVAGVRDATRYVSRYSERDLCPSGSLANFSGPLLRIVRNNVQGTDITPSGVTVVSVVPSLTCPTGTYRNGPVSIATVTATVTITLPFSDVFDLIGVTMNTFDATITDRTRIFGS